MSKKEVYVIVSADNIAYELYVNGPYYSYEAAQDALKNEFKESCVVNKDNKHKVIDKRIEGDMYRVLRENQSLCYGWIKKIAIADSDTEAERWIKAVKDHMEAKGIAVPESESDISHIAEEAQHYAAKDEYFVGGFWNAIALAVQDYNEENTKREDGDNDDTNNAAKSV